MDVIPIKAPKDLYASIVHPQIEIATKDARSILKNQNFAHRCRYAMG